MQRGLISEWNALLLGQSLLHLRQLFLIEKTELSVLVESYPSWEEGKKKIQNHFSKLTLFEGKRTSEQTCSEKIFCAKE